MRNLSFLPLLAPALALAAAAPFALPGSGVGDPLPEAELEGFTQTGATTLSDYAGRAILIEFFAFW